MELLVGIDLPCSVNLSWRKTKP